MANAMYPLARQAFADGDLDWTGTDWRIALMADTYAYSDAHEFYDDVSAHTLAVSANLSAKTNVFGVCDAADVTLASVPADDARAIIVYQWTGVAATSRVVIFYDTTAAATLITLATDGGDVLVRWSNGPTKMFRV